MKPIKLTCKIEAISDHFALKLPEDARPMVQELLRLCFEKRGGFVSFQLSMPRRPRSTGYKSQSHHFNGHVQQISMETGQPFEDVKKFLKGQAVSQGYPMLTKDGGAPLLDLWGNVQGISEADSSVEECGILIDAAHQFAAEFGINLIEE